MKDRIHRLEGMTLAIAEQKSPTNFGRRYNWHGRPDRNLRTTVGRPICNFCNKVGHIEMKCRNKSLVHRIQKLETAAHVSMSVWDAADSNKNLCCIDYSDARQSKLHKCVTFKGKVANYQTDIVIDSGSGITVMSLELCNLINKYAFRNQP